MRFSANSAIADFVVAPGSMVVTSRPLAASMILTVIVTSLRPSLADMPMAQVRHWSVHAWAWCHPSTPRSGQLETWDQDGEAGLGAVERSEAHLGWLCA